MTTCSIMTLNVHTEFHAECLLCCVTIQLIMLNVVILSVILLNVIMLNVLAPTTKHQQCTILLLIISLPIFHLSCRIFEHFATNPDPVTEFIILRSALPSKAPLWRQNQWIHFPFNKQIHPLYFKDRIFSKIGSSNPDPDPCIVCTI